MVQVMDENSDKVLNEFPEESFQRLFWQQQLANAKKKGPNQYRWHPMIVKWCLNMRLISGASYHAMRTSGFISLPSERSLRDYTNYIKATPGLHFNVLKQMKEQSKVSEMPAAKSYVTILLDEMKVKEDIVYDKLTGGMIGFVNLGSINDQLRQAAEEDAQKTKHPPVADHILAVMVRGLFFKFEFPLAHYPSLGVTSSELLPIVWEVVRFVETTGLKVIAITADGAAPNRRFFRMHGNGNGLVYKVKNIYAADERYIYFISDPPHLVKTIRNCLSHSYGPGSTREMQVNGRSIKWSHIQELCDKKVTTSVASSGLSLLPKLKREHVYLTSFSRMRVDLAAQVLSKSVADAFQYYGNLETAETERFIRLVDRFFDCLNVRSVSEWVTKLKPDRKPYYSPDDKRIKWLKDEFVKYLTDWESFAKDLCKGTDMKYYHFTLSRETLEGIYMTVESFVELVSFLLDKHQKDNLFVLSERLSQDPLENYFGQQRARGGRNENPSVSQCLVNANAIRVQRSTALDPVRGNCRRKRTLFKGDDSMVIDNTPLPKRKCKRSKTE